MKRLKLIGIAVGAFVLTFALGYVIAVRWLFPPLPEPENGIVVPDLAGSTVQSAQEKLRALGLRLTDITEISHPTQPPGVIIAQSPIPGQQLRELGAVRVAVSTGMPRVESLAPPDTVLLPVDTVTPPPPDTVIAQDSISLR
jgi:beta-lactam-binding protein with PASTA domain